MEINILQLIASNSFLTVNKNLIITLGLEEAVLIGELASEFDYWNKRNELQDGFFYSTVENIEEKTTLSSHKQRRILKSLKEKEILDVKIKGIPAKRYIKINEKQLLNYLNINMLNNSISSCLKIEELEVEKLNGNNNIINNNINNNNIINNKKEKKESEFDVLINEIENNDLKDTLYEFIKMRKTIKKPLTTRALQLIINKLHDLADNDEEKIDILNQSIMNNWLGVFPLKTKDMKGNEEDERFKELERILQNR